jgi:hypothetical protein
LRQRTYCCNGRIISIAATDTALCCNAHIAAMEAYKETGPTTLPTCLNPPWLMCKTCPSHCRIMVANPACPSRHGPVRTARRPRCGLTRRRAGRSFHFGNHAYMEARCVGTLLQWTHRHNGRLAAMEASPQWAYRCNGCIAAMDTSLLWTHRYNHSRRLGVGGSGASANASISVPNTSLV